MDNYLKTMEIGWITHMACRTTEGMLKLENDEEEHNNAWDIVNNYTVEQLNENYYAVKENMTISFLKTEENKPYSLELSKAVADYLKANDVEIYDEDESGMLYYYWEFETVFEKKQHQTQITDIFNRICK